MPAYSVPGVYVTESTLTALTNSNGGQAVGAFFGEARRGPTVPTLIQDWSSYVTLFGDIDDTYDLGYAVYHYFANGGRSCYVTRVTGAASVAADSLAAESEGVQWQPNGGTSYQLFDVTANSEGDWGNSITVAAIPGSIPPSSTSFGSFTVVIEVDGVEVERWVDCEVDPSSNRFVETIVNQYSSYVTASNVVSIATQNIEDATVSSTVATIDVTGHGYIVGQAVNVQGISFNANLNGVQTITAVTTDTFDFATAEADDVGPNVGGTVALAPSSGDVYVATKFPLDDGVDAVVADADYTASLNGLDTIEGNLVINLPGVTGTAPVSSAVTKAGSRGDSFVIIDPDVTDTTLGELQTTASNFAAVSPLSYAAHYAPALEMVDPARSGPTAVRTTAPGGAIAGLYVRTDVQRTVAKAPAGYNANIVGAFAPSVKLTPTQIGTLYVDSVPVNSFKSVPGAGVTVNGARTLAKTDPDKFIPVRRTLNYLKYSLKDLTAFAVFEPNDDRLWEKLRQTTTGFLGNFWRQGGLAGARSTEAFYVICDETNNTAGTIDNGEVHLTVGVALSNPAEFVVINLSQWSGGASSATESA
jgi:phage tail sheath protein FI